MEAKKPPPPPNITVGLKAGGSFPQVLNRLSSTYTLALEVGIRAQFIESQSAGLAYESFGAHQEQGTHVAFGGTTTDLLDAQSALTQARLNLVRSKYQRALAWVQLRRAMGG
ncbi:MAG: TolC family protein [Archangium sp.]|nr:TolC family protein [Archangium sp.]